MPKVNLLKDKMKERTRARIEYCLSRTGRSRADYMKILGLSRSTLHRRYDNPNEFTLGEIRQIPGLTDEDIICIVRGI